MGLKNTLVRPAQGNSVLGAVKASDTRSHPTSNLPNKRIKPQPYVPLGQGKRR